MLKCHMLCYIISTIAVLMTGSAVHEVLNELMTEGVWQPVTHDGKPLMCATISKHTTLTANVTQDDSKGIKGTRIYENGFTHSNFGWLPLMMISQICIWWLRLYNFSSFLTSNLLPPPSAASIWTRNSCNGLSQLVVTSSLVFCAALKRAALIVVLQLRHRRFLLGM